MTAYAAAVRHLFLSDPTDPAERHTLAQVVLMTSPDGPDQLNAYRLTQEAYDLNPGAFRERIRRMWAALPATQKPELDPFEVVPTAHQRRPERPRDTIGLSPHLRRRAHT
ncbi:hypothetical protein [Burkholderia vietnamiensis]|uniref:hypothetical protein n=1 Tax=Burkholderia vietnamiensis TaxID=60552 RepID=UPI00075610B0|nr:hypothetical protein [Burkholderia vietnamiensis]KVF07827.1 hypothetical protein WJ04_12220 [Burkholderia vietnamiensis]KVF34769.1 hypothetical protein WJ08_05070 [Burkholderia vietnamiensis]KVF41258.1 hypothetical protein WJ10_17185 [Burkholderia vietnamiensis]KVF78911.1 hypothetical protein WJ18_16110 [Burkholderia vietnamiensis]KVF82605.1 hypothetical protein WJ19_24815 [Burkholderia vietnamiensis]